MEKSGSTIMQNVQQSLFHKHAECFVLYSTSHSSYFLTLAGIVYVKRKNISVNPFQSNFSANCILPSSYLFWGGGQRLVDYL
jgi:hypothetical protein